MAFSLTMQPYLADRYYHYLKERFPDQALDALATAFHRYASQRGERAAQRCIRDGKALSFATYQCYREVRSTPEMKALDKPSQGTTFYDGETFISCVTYCQTHEVFRDLGTPEELERYFCGHIDRLNVLGFSPDISYEVDATLYEAPFCHHRCTNPGEGVEFGVRMPDTPPYPFIVANEYFTMRKVLTAIFGEEGVEIARRVREDFIARYEPDDWAEIARYERADFNIYYPKCMEGSDL